MKSPSTVVTPEQISGWLNFQQANRVLEGLLEDRLQSEADLSVAEYEVLFRLRSAGADALQMSQIASQIINSPSGTTRIADRLEKDGLIARATPRDNRRVVQVRLTDRGQRVLARADTAFRRALHETFAAHLSATELAGLRLLMRRLLERNGAWLDARCQPAIATPVRRRRSSR